MAPVGFLVMTIYMCPRVAGYDIQPFHNLAPIRAIAIKIRTAADASILLMVQFEFICPFIRKGGKKGKKKKKEVRTLKSYKLFYFQHGFIAPLCIFHSLTFCMSYGTFPQGE